MIFSEREGQKLDGIHNYRQDKINAFETINNSLNSLNPASLEEYLTRNWMKTSPGKSDFVQRGF